MTGQQIFVFKFNREIIFILSVFNCYCYKFNYNTFVFIWLVIALNLSQWQTFTAFDLNRDHQPAW